MTQQPYYFRKVFLYYHSVVIERYTDNGWKWKSRKRYVISKTFSPLRNSRVKKMIEIIMAQKWALVVSEYNFPEKI